MNKRGIFFTFIAIMLVGFIIVAFSSQTFVTLKDKVPITKSRVQTADDYLKNLKFAYLERSLIHSSIAALKTTALYVNSTGNYLNNRQELNDIFEEVLLNGTIGGVESDALIGRTGAGLKDTPIMRDNNLTYRLRQIENASTDILFINTTFFNDYNDFNIILFQDNDTGPFAVGVNATFHVMVASDVAYWNTSFNLTLHFNIEELDDPMYMIGENTLFGEDLTNKINESNIETWNTSATAEFVDTQAYRYDEEGPSYLERFYDDTTGSVCCGITSLVNPVPFEHGNSEEMQSYVDYCFFHPNTCQSDPFDLFYLVGITDAGGGGMPGTPDTFAYGLKIDAQHLSDYNLTDAGLNEQVGTP